MLEGNPSGRPADSGLARGELCIHQAAITDYNRATGHRLSHKDVDDPEVAYEVGAWYLGRYGHPGVEKMGQVWNQGPSAVRNKRGISYGQRLANLMEGK